MIPKEIEIIHARILLAYGCGVVTGMVCPYVGPSLLLGDHTSASPFTAMLACSHLRWTASSQSPWDSLYASLSSPHLTIMTA